MTRIEKLIKVGKELSLSGEELREWAESQLREQRQKDAIAYERLRDESEIERRKIEEERMLVEQKRLVTEREIELMSLRREVEYNSSDSASSVNQTEQNMMISHKLPRLPVFQETVDDISVYLDRFEKYAIMNKFPKDTHTMVLSTYLKGSALEVFHRLSIDEAQKYDVLKTSLLKRYEVTAEQHRRKFREVIRGKN